MLILPHRTGSEERAAWRRAGGVLADVADFLDAWDAPCPTMELQTSGSTGAPTIIRARKEAMRASAAMSCRAFGLHEGDTALLCLPLRYIAGKMMLVRALVAGLRVAVVEPCGNPLAAAELEGVPLDFAPLVPLQAARALASPEGRARLARLHTLLLGGAFIDPQLEEALQAFPACRAYASYGMTETLSHIALRRLNGEARSHWYTPLPGVAVSLSAEGALCISAPRLGIDHLETNDLAELEQGSDSAAPRFRILGRRDAVINSGGIKVQAEDVECQLRAATGLELVAVPLPHPELGECVALLWEGDAAAEPRLRAACEDERLLPRYHRPRVLLHTDTLPRTATGKPARAACRSLLTLMKTSQFVMQAKKEIKNDIGQAASNQDMAPSPFDRERG